MRLISMTRSEIIQLKNENKRLQDELNKTKADLIKLQEDNRLTKESYTKETFALVEKTKIEVRGECRCEEKKYDKQ